MKKIHLSTLAIVVLLLQSAALFATKRPPKPIYPIPEPRQVAWQQMETYAFIHFGTNTFTNREWGYGDAAPQVFNPTRLDCEQWVKTLLAAGMKGVILTAKHHDGFCLWPSRYTDYTIARSPYKQGKGDIVGELAEACKKYGLKFGVYLSPWDRHQASYGTTEYVEYYHHQLEELMTQYGPVFEVWFDGANGGDGWYGGAKETRKIDRRTYYDLPRAWSLIDRLQPQAICFSDGGPGCRWVGNERGQAGTTNWSFLRSKEVYPGYPHAEELTEGHADGDKWIAAECDVSIRPGWFYHKEEDAKVKTPDELAEIYYASVGRNATMLLNFPVDKTGRIHPTDSANAVAFHHLILSQQAVNLFKDAIVLPSCTRGRPFLSKYMLDDDYESYWATPDKKSKATLTISLPFPKKISQIHLQEYIPLGQRVCRFAIDRWEQGQWIPVETDEPLTTIGYKRIVRFQPFTAKRLRIRFLESRGPLCISELKAY